MVMRKIFGHKKKTDGDASEAHAEESVPPEIEAADETAARAKPEPAAAPPAEPAKAEEAAPAAPEAATTTIKGTIPYHSSLLDRLLYMFNDPETASSIQGPDEFVLEFLAVGERFWIRKEANGPLQHGSGAIPDEDVYVRVSDSAVQQLLSAATFDEFSQAYMKHYKNPQAGSFVKVELRKDISSLNRVGYARVPLLKLLIGVKR